jgi:hypothetical protein
VPVGQWPPGPGVGPISLFLPSVALTGNCNAKNVAGPISGSLRHHADLAVPPAAVRNVAGPIPLSVAPQGRCEKCCWTYFTLGRASVAVKNIVGPIHSALGGTPVPAAKNVDEPISPSLAAGTAVNNVVGLIPRQPGSACALAFLASNGWFLITGLQQTDTRPATGS